MKKLVTAACALVAGLALADGVESANIVGYTEVTLNKEWTIFGINFTAVDGSNLSLQDAVPYVDGMAKGANTSAADQIQIQNASGGYATYYMSNGKNAKGGTVAKKSAKISRKNLQLASLKHGAFCS